LPKALQHVPAGTGSTNLSHSSIIWNINYIHNSGYVTGCLNNLHLIELISLRHFHQRIAAGLRTNHPKMNINILSVNNLKLCTFLLLVAVSESFNLQMKTGDLQSSIFRLDPFGFEAV
jgi:hypothetical protein